MDGDRPDPLAHVPANCRAGLAVANANKPLAQLNGDTSGILARITKGERAVDVAKDIGVSHQALYAWLLQNNAEGWQALSAARCLARLEQAEIDLDAAEDPIAISRARESASIAKWSLERTARRYYGDNKADSAGITVQVLIARDGTTQTVIEQTPTNREEAA